MDDQNRPTVTTVSKAVRILKTFTFREPELGVNEISRRVGLHNSNVSRILATLEYEGLVERVPDSTNYRLGVGILMLASKTFAHMDLRRAAGEVMQQLADESGETIALSVLQNDQVVALDVALSQYSVRDVSWIGKHHPVHCSSSGKILLAFASPHELDRIFSKPLVQHTEKTVVDPDVLRAELAEIRRFGLSKAYGEMEPGLNAMSAPVFGRQGNLVASLAISGPAYRLTADRLAALEPNIRDAARKISQRLGYIGG